MGCACERNEGERGGESLLVVGGGAGGSFKRGASNEEGTGLLLMYFQKGVTYNRLT